MGKRCAFIKLCLLILMITSDVKAKYRKPMINYPKDTLFWATDFFVKGCKNFIQNCPASYKNQEICARSYNGGYRNFINYCEMQYENCNTWRNWRVFKRNRC
ncbi:uncharacterized protein LOC124539650 [Vanessa cardui]|uniref:uncharacterized protein LOC124539650 n=1 Tax=Vanessa cardui TaxID=171605 RepID=UPI001F13BB7E|nr:uncharacterized protein LOC124539650 [Vanessa cardui]